jgi:hypothetical protein
MTSIRKLNPDFKNQDEVLGILFCSWQNENKWVSQGTVPWLVFFGQMDTIASVFDINGNFRCEQENRNYLEYIYVLYKMN